MPSFFSDDDRCGNDLNDMMDQAPGAIKRGLILGYIFALPIMLFEKIVGGVADAAAANARAQQQKIHEPPPKVEPPPWTRQQHSQPPPPPPTPQPDPLEKFRLILGVSKTANKEEIKKRYRFKSHCCHPDKVTESMKDEAEEEFKRISEAYHVLVAVAPEAPVKSKPQARQAEAVPPKPSPKPQHPDLKKDSAPTQAAKQATPKPAPAAAQPKPAKSDYVESFRNTGTKGCKPTYL